MQLLILTLALGVLLVSGLAACDQREGPPRPIGSATNKHFEESAQSSPGAPARRPSSPTQPSPDAPADR